MKKLTNMLFYFTRLLNTNDFVFFSFLRIYVIYLRKKTTKNTYFIKFCKIQMKRKHTHKLLASKTVKKYNIDIVIVREMEN